MNSVNLPNGYKQTKVGAIPEDWEVVRVKDIFHFIKTYSFPRSKLTDTGNIEYLHYGDIHKKYKYHLDFKKNILPKIQLDEIAEENFVKNGDLFIADASEDYDDIGKSAEAINLIHRRVLSGLHTFLLRDVKNKFANGYRGFIFYNQNVSKSIKKIATGISVLGISKSNLGKIKIPLPPLKEQEKIAKILTTWDKAIDLQEKLIKEKETYKLGLMQNLFTCKIRFNGFSGELDETHLYAIVKLQSGFAFKSNKFKSIGIPIIRISNIDNNSIYMNMKEIVFHDKINNDEQYTIKENDLLIALSGATTGKVSIYNLPQKAYLNQRVGLFKTINNKIDYSFLSQYILSNLFKIKLRRLLVSGAQPNISPKDIEKLKIKLPSLKEQQKISNFLSLTDKEIELQKNKLTELKNQKKSLMQNLLSGKVRVKV